MVESIPSLRRQLAEARQQIAALEAREPVERVVERRVEVPVDRVVYRDRRVEVEVDRVVERVVREPAPAPVVITRRVEVPVLKEIYVTDPVLEQTIRDLQERLRQCISQSDS